MIPKVRQSTIELPPCGAGIDLDRQGRTHAEWAAYVALSERSLDRLMVAETGLSFGRWRRQLHLVVALRELASGATIQSVSADLGYKSPTAFIVMFKKAMGTTPARYFSARSDGPVAR